MTVASVYGLPLHLISVKDPAGRQTVMMGMPCLQGEVVSSHLLFPSVEKALLAGNSWGLQTARGHPAKAPKSLVGRHPGINQRPASTQAMSKQSRSINDTQLRRADIEIGQELRTRSGAPPAKLQGIISPVHGPVVVHLSDSPPNVIKCSVVAAGFPR